MSLLRTLRPEATVDELCGLFGRTRQAYYKRDDEADYQVMAMEALIIEYVVDVRSKNPRLGSVKLLVKVRQRFPELSGRIPGRDAFISLLRREGLLLRLKRRRHYKTTDSDHPYFKYPNLVKGLTLTRPNMVWVSDITYVETEEGVCYLSLVTDAYSRKIVGWALGDTLAKEHPLRALSMAFEDMEWIPGTTLIHHSDRGCQYCSHEYVACLKAHAVQISMTQSGDPLENALAERTNGILKTEWLYHMTFSNMKHCESELCRIISFYNDERPHMSLGYLTPSQVHRGEGIEKKMWRSPWNKSE